MVAIKTPTVDEAFKGICGALREKPALAAPVVNHIASKHGIHSLPAFHKSDAITPEQKLATYGEIVMAIVNNQMDKLRGQVANGQAAEAEKPEDEDRIRTVMPKEEPPAPRGARRIPNLPEHPLPHRHSVLPEVKADPEPEVDEPKPAPKPRSSDPLTDRLRELLVEVIGEIPASLDESEVGQIVDTKLKAHEDAITTNVTQIVDAAIKQAKESIDETLKQASAGRPSITVHEFRIGEAVAQVDGVIHRQLPQIVAWLNADVPVWLWGQAGGGKTHLARQAAAALGLPFHCAPIDETITVGKLVGFRNVANGDFVKGLMYDAFKSGGVQLLDEIDTNATAIASTNSLTANGHYTFPNGEEVTRHAQFRLIAGANTKGTGAVAGYTARIRMDAATLDRFAVIKLDYDPGLELALTCGGANPSTPWQPSTPATDEQCQLFVKWVQKVRAAASDSVLISPRASYLGVKALRAGIPLAEVADALVFKLVTPDTQTRLTSNCGTAY